MRESAVERSQRAFQDLDRRCAALLAAADAFESSTKRLHHASVGLVGSADELVEATSRWAAPGEASARILRSL